MADDPIRIIIADDHELVRRGIRALIMQVPGVEVVGEAGEGYEALALIKKHRPDVVVMDIGLPGLNGLDVTARVTKEHPAVCVLILSMHSTEEYIVEAVRLGARGYLLKDSAPSELETAVRLLARGEMYLSPKISSDLADYLRRADSDLRLPPAPTTLTTRQREILQAIAEGKTTKEIARRLNVSIKTVETHRAQLMGRLGIHDIAGLVRYAVRIGLISPEQ